MRRRVNSDHPQHRHLPGLGCTEEETVRLKLTWSHFSSNRRFNSLGFLTTISITLALASYLYSPLGCSSGSLS
jgi:hypothetical protein